MLTGQVAMTVGQEEWVRGQNIQVIRSLWLGGCFYHCCLREAWAYVHDIKAPISDKHAPLSCQSGRAGGWPPPPDRDFRAGHRRVSWKCQQWDPQLLCKAVPGAQVRGAQQQPTHTCSQTANHTQMHWKSRNYLQNEEKNDRFMQKGKFILYTVLLLLFFSFFFFFFFFFDATKKIWREIIYISHLRRFHTAGTSALNATLTYSVEPGQPHTNVDPCNWGTKKKTGGSTV